MKTGDEPLTAFFRNYGTVQSFNTAPTLIKSIDTLRGDGERPKKQRLEELRIHLQKLQEREEEHTAIVEETGLLEIAKSLPEMELQAKLERSETQLQQEKQTSAELRAAAAEKDKEIAHFRALAESQPGPSGGKRSRTSADQSDVLEADVDPQANWAIERTILEGKLQAYEQLTRSSYKNIGYADDWSAPTQDGSHEPDLVSYQQALTQEGENFKEWATAKRTGEEKDKGLMRSYVGAIEKLRAGLRTACRISKKDREVIGELEDAVDFYRGKAATENPSQ